jgi:biopolymer transport protein ExbB/TolQ
MTKTAQLEIKDLTQRQRDVLSIIKAYEQSKMLKITLEEFVLNYQVNEVKDWNRQFEEMFNLAPTQEDKDEIKRHIETNKQWIEQRTNYGTTILSTGHYIGLDRK